MAKGKMLICDRHKKRVPLIWTFAFNGSEYWCPYCGHDGGMFGTGTRVNSTPKLESEKTLWIEKSKDFLDAASTFTCSELEFEGKTIKQQDLPDAEKVRLQKIIEDWKYATISTSADK